MEATWMVFMRQADDHVKSILTVTNARELAAQWNLTRLGVVRVEMKRPNEHGLYSKEEYDTLAEIDNRLNTYLEAPGRVLPVGRITANGVQDYYFYLESKDGWEGRVDEAMAAFPAYSFDCNVWRDDEWRAYWSHLYPTEEEFHVERDQRVIQALESHGDALDKAREIMHFAYFPSEQARQAYSSRVVAAGYAIVRLTNPDGEQADFGIVFVRDDVPTLWGIGDVTLPLLRHAKECGGDYDGWESAVVR